MSSERRRFERQPCEVSCKIAPEGELRFVPARTINVSQGGVLIEFRAGREPRVGERLGVAVDRGAGLLSLNDLVPARIVRITPGGNGRLAALAFERIEERTLAA